LRPQRLRRHRVRRRQGGVDRGEAEEAALELRHPRAVLLRQRRGGDRQGVTSVRSRGIRDHRHQPRLPGTGTVAGGRAGARHRVAGHRHLRLAAGRGQLRAHHRAAAGPEDRGARGGRLAARADRRRTTPGAGRAAGPLWIRQLPARPARARTGVVKVDIREMTVPGAWVVTPRVLTDARGAFTESFKASEFEKATGRPLDLRQVNVSVSAAGVLRGIHYTEDPPGQAKYVTCVRGAFLDVVVDLRPGSPTFGHWDSVLIDDVNR